MLSDIKEKLDGIYGGMLFLLFTLIIHVKVIPTLPSEQVVYGVATYTEMFHQMKGQVLIWYVALFAILTALSFVTGEIRVKIDRFLFACLGIYGVFAIVSYIYATDKDLAWRGALDHYEGVTVLVSYVILSMLFYFTTTEAKAEKWLRGYLIINTVIMSFVGISQMIGANILNHPWILKAIIWPAKSAVIDEIGNNAVRAAYGTLGNQNFMGSYLVLVIPMIIYGFVKAEKHWKIIYGVIVLLGYLMLLGSGSRAGLSGFCVALPITYGYLSNRSEYIKPLVIALGIGAGSIGVNYLLTGRLDIADVCLLGISVLGAASATILVRYFVSKGINPPMKKIILSFGAGALILGLVGGAFLLSTAVRPEWPVTKLEASGSEASLKVYGDEILVKAGIGTVEITNRTTGANWILSPGHDVEQILLSDKKGITVNLYKDTKQENLFALVFQQPYLALAFGEFDGTVLMRVVGNGGIPIEVEHPKRVKLLDGMEKSGSGRGYIWSRTLPMIQQHPVFGVGPDNFVVTFPQNDLLGKMALNSTYLIVDKPHNWYMQMAVNTGLVSSLAIMTLLLGLGWRFVISGIESHENMLLVPVFASITGYSATALFNDSMVSVAPLLWAMVGIAFALLPTQKHEVVENKARK